MSPVGTNSPRLHAFVRFNEWGQAEMGCSEPGRDCAKACLSSHICHRAAGLELEGLWDWLGCGGTCWSPPGWWALGAALPGQEEGARWLLLGHPCLGHRGCIREQIGSRAGIAEVSSVTGFKQLLVDLFVFDCFFLVWVFFLLWFPRAT